MVAELATESPALWSRVNPARRGAHSKTPAIQRFMPGWLFEDFVSITPQPFIGNVPGKREHRQQQDAADSFGGHLADGVTDWMQAGAAELTAITPERWPAPLEILCLR